MTQSCTLWSLVFPISPIFLLFLYSQVFQFLWLLSTVSDAMVTMQVCSSFWAVVAFPLDDLEERLLTHIVLMVISLPTNLPAHQQHTRIHFPLLPCQHLLSLHSNKLCVLICNSLIICDVGYIFFYTFCKGISMQLYFQAFVWTAHWLATS